MNGLQISTIFFVVVMMIVTFVLVITIVGKITESSRNVKRREDYIVGKKKEEKKAENTKSQKNNKKQTLSNKGAFTKLNKILAEELEKSDISKKPEDFIIIWIVVTFVPGLLFMLIFKNQLIAPMLMGNWSCCTIIYIKSKQKREEIHLNHS